MPETYLQDNVIIFTIIITLLINKMKGLAHQNLFFAWVVNLIGTFFHELAHLIISMLLNGKPTKVSLFPKKTEDGYTLGYVLNTNITWYNALPIAFAPLSLLVLAYFIYTDFFYYVDFTTMNFLIYIFLLISFIDSAILSRQDIKVAFSNVGFILYFILIGVSWYFLYYLGHIEHLKGLL